MGPPLGDSKASAKDDSDWSRRSICREASLP